MGDGLAFAERAEMTSLLAAAGFVGVRSTDLSHGYLSPHLLYEAGLP
jgi:hypothetical protein